MLGGELQKTPRETPQLNVLGIELQTTFQCGLRGLPVPGFELGFGKRHDRLQVVGCRC